MHLTKTRARLFAGVAGIALMGTVVAGCEDPTTICQGISNTIDDLQGHAYQVSSDLAEAEQGSLEARALQLELDALNQTISVKQAALEQCNYNSRS